MSEEDKQTTPRILSEQAGQADNASANLSVDEQAEKAAEPKEDPTPTSPPVRGGAIMPDEAEMQSADQEPAGPAPETKETEEYTPSPLQGEGGGEVAEPIIIGAPASLVKPVIAFLERLGVLRGQANTKRQENKARNLEKILEYAQKNNKITNNEVEKITGVSDRQALNYLQILVKKGKFERFGSKRNTFYKPVSK